MHNKNNKLMLDLRLDEAHAVPWRTAMTENIKLPRRLSDEPKAPKPRRPSHERVIDNIDLWANSAGLQPPSLPEAKTA
jgi:hypothetical protein